MQLVTVFIDLNNKRPHTAKRNGLIGDRANALMTKGLESYWVTERHMHEGYNNYYQDDLQFHEFSQWVSKNLYYDRKQVFVTKPRANLDAIISLCRPTTKGAFWFVADSLKLITEAINIAWPIIRNNIVRHQRGRPISHGSNRSNRIIINSRPAAASSSSFNNSHQHKEQMAYKVQQAEVTFKKNLLVQRENHIKGREEEIKKRQDEIKRREKEIRRREEEVRRREEEVRRREEETERLKIEQQNEHSRFIDEQQNFCMYNMFYHCYLTITYKLY